MSMTQTTRNELMKLILPSLIRKLGGSHSAWCIVNEADTIIDMLDGKGYFQDEKLEYDYGLLPEYDGLFDPSPLQFQ